MYEDTITAMAVTCGEVDANIIGEEGEEFAVPLGLLDALVQIWQGSIEDALVARLPERMKIWAEGQDVERIMFAAED